MNILMTGGTGFIGSALTRVLSNDHTISILSRQPLESNTKIQGVKQLSEIDSDATFDVVINLAGEPIADKRWSKKQKSKIMNSRLQTTGDLIELLNRMTAKPKVFISGSAVGYYGIGIDNSITDENALGDSSFASQLCQQWELKAKEAEKLGIRTCLLRTGIVLGASGGVLKKMHLPFKIGLGGQLGTGKQWMPWIHIDDMVGLIRHCITDSELKGPINCTVPSPVTNTQFTYALGRTLDRPTFLTMPTPMVKLLMGEMGESLLLSGKKIFPKKALESGYSFQFNDLETALKQIFK